jgi:hypothetical protein
LTSSKKNAALEGRWNQLKEYEECEELFRVRLFYCTDLPFIMTIMNKGNRGAKRLF